MREHITLAEGRTSVTVVPFSFDPGWKVFHSWVVEKIEFILQHVRCSFPEPWVHRSPAFTRIQPAQGGKASHWRGRSRHVDLSKRELPQDSQETRQQATHSSHHTTELP